jgi:predicted transcriptional regulator
MQGFSINPFGEDETPGWGAALTPAEPKDIVAEAMKKENVIKDVVAAQEDLRVLVSRVEAVQKEIEKLSSGNATLQMYIDNLTKQMARRQ